MGPHLHSPNMEPENHTVTHTSDPLNVSLTGITKVENSRWDQSSRRVHLSQQHRNL